MNLKGQVLIFQMDSIMIFGDKKVFLEKRVSDMAV